MKSTHATIAGAVFAAAILLPSPRVHAASAQVSEVVKDVTVGSSQAAVGDTVSGSTSLKTGSKSRAELTFEDSTLLRIGSNTIFSFRKSARKGKDFNLTHGTAFVSAPDKHDGVRINCGGVTAAITGSVSTVTNTNSGVGMFAATGNNSLTFPDGTTVVVNPFNFTWIPWMIDAGGNKVPDVDNAVTLPYDALAQVDTGWASKNINPGIRERILDKKRELFGAGTLANNPHIDPTQERGEILDHRTLPRDTPPAGGKTCCYDF